MRKRIIKQTMACLLGTALVITQPGLYLPADAAASVSSIRREERREEKSIITNGGFENGTEGWKAEPQPGTFEAKTADEASVGSVVEGGNALNFWNETDTSFKCVQTIENLPAGTYKLTAQSQGGDGEKVYVYLDGKKGDVFQENSGWGVWKESSGTFTIDKDMPDIEAGVYVECSAGGWGWIDNIKIEKAVAEPAVSLQDLKELVATVPADYTSIGFTKDSEKALSDALSIANSLVTSAGNDAAQITAAYKALSAAVDGLALSSELFIKKINNYNEDSIRGMDVSSYLSIMKAFEKVRENMKAAGASEAEIARTGFKDWNGKVLDEQGFFNLLAKSGVNYIRIRVWNNPYDANGKSYGGGNNDINTAIEMGKYVTKAGMKVLIDFHLSDFWADPGKQQAPKAWASYTADQKAAAVSEYITDCLSRLIKDNSVDVAMVQVGNETNGAVCGVSEWDDMNKIFDAGCDAVHAAGKDILAAIHFTNPEKDGLLMDYASKLAGYDGDGDGVKEGVSYDVLASSYYPNSHGTMENLTNVLTDVAKTYDKYVMVAETSWANTYKLGHSASNSDFRTGDYVNYNVTLQGQANEVRDVINAVNNIDVTLSNGKKAALGFFYWEPAWISAMSVYDENGNLKADAEKIEAENRELDVECGSGWASSYAAEYDPDDAGLWWGGSGMTNQSVFDFNGSPLPVFDVYNPYCLKYGAKAPEVKPDGYASEEISIETGQTVDAVLPKITVTYNDSTEEAKEVNWDKEDVAKVNNAASTTAGIGSYTINGTLADDSSYKVDVKVNVNGINLLADPGFENTASAWTVTGEGAAVKSGEDKRTGEMCLHFYSDADFKFMASLATTVSKAGYYKAYIYMQGLSSAGTREGEDLRLVAVTGDGKEYKSESTMLAGWLGWKQVIVDNIYVSEDMVKNGKNTITLSVNAALNAGAWGTMDDASLYLDKEESSSQVTETVPQSITGKKSYTKVYGSKPFKLNAKAEGTLSYTSSNKKVAEAGKDGTITIKGTGKAVITVKAAATGQYKAASKKITITVKPEKTSGIKVKAANKKITASWKKTAKADGYKIQYSTAKSFKDAKEVTAAGTSKLIKGLKSKTTYYVRVCAYVKDGSRKITGAYSKTVKAAVK
ncbi:MAG: glycosyl hydrolase 53 family protein [Lachnospiraceae bacterium]|nr:glycosyl hydrolase 53 family protein [Lachnospiraceae bacterium]